MTALTLHSEGDPGVEDISGVDFRELLLGLIRILDPKLNFDHIQF